MNQPVHSRKTAPRKAPQATPKAPTRTNDPERTRREILSVATEEFAAKGLSGARIDAIADATRTSKRMIYYYFGSKEGLYLAALEESYRSMRSIEGELHLADLAPEAALRALVEFTFEHHWSHQPYIRLVMAENINRGEYLRQSNTIQQLNVPAINAIRELYERGVKSGQFRKSVDPLDIHASISALCFFNVSNRYTFDLIFKRDAESAEVHNARRASVVEMIVRFVKK